jgi:magnesium chelatase family protein
MIAKVYSVVVSWLDGQLVEVEVDIHNGMPAFIIVWLPDTAIQESRERVRSAIKNSDLPFPRTKITVNLAPADIKKTGPSFDLPIALWILLEECKISQIFSMKHWLSVSSLSMVPFVLFRQFFRQWFLQKKNDISVW